MLPDRDGRSLRDDDRGLAVAIIGFVAMIVIAAFLYTLFEPAATAVFDASAERATSQEVTDAIALRRQIFGYVLFFALFLSGLYIIARATLESRGPG